MNESIPLPPHRCATCGGPFVTGDLMVGSRTPTHVACATVALLRAREAGFFLEAKTRAKDCQAHMLKGVREFNARAAVLGVTISEKYVDEVIANDEAEIRKNVSWLASLTTPEQYRYAGGKLLQEWRSATGCDVFGDLALDRTAFVEGTTPQWPAKEVISSHKDWFAARWVSQGAPIFRLTHGLTASLALTDCGGVSLSDVRLPFRAFMVELPRPGEILFQPGAEGEGGVHPTCYLTFQGTKSEFDLPAELEAERVILQQRVIDSRGVEKDRAAFRDWAEFRSRVNRLAPESGIVISAIGSKYTFMGQFLYQASEDVDDWVKAIGSSDLTPEQMSSIRVMIRLVVNLCLYLESIKGERLDRCFEAPRREGLSKTWTVGRDVKLPGSLLQAARFLTVEGEAKPMWHLRSRFIVRGHWRNQAVGPKRQQHKRLWIEPHWKGPEGWDPEGPWRSYDVATVSERGKDQ